MKPIGVWRAFQPRRRKANARDVVPVFDSPSPKTMGLSALAAVRFACFSFDAESPRRRATTLVRFAAAFTFLLAVLCFRRIRSA